MSQRLHRALLFIATSMSVVALTNSPSIFSALPDQLGFKLESSRAMVETLVVDRIERPSEN